MKLTRGWGSGPAVLPCKSAERIDGAERWQRSVRRAAELAAGVHAVDAQLRALMTRARFRRDQPR